MGEFLGKLKVESCGCTAFVPSLCIGLDMAWHGGSKKDPASQQDVVLAVSRTSISETPELQILRLRLVDRDPEARQLLKAVSDASEAHCSSNLRLFIGVDAPLQAKQRPDQRWTYRASDRALSEGRMAVDRRQGGSLGWHPKLQPGYPIPPRVQALVNGLQSAELARIWQPQCNGAQGILLESFPSEALWSARTKGLYPISMAAEVKAYKKQRGQWLEASRVRSLVETVLLPLGGFLAIPTMWASLVEQLIDWLLSDPNWEQEGRYRGGKGLDDAVDSAICLLIALCASEGNAHAWFDPEHPEDGHIVGPGSLDLFKCLGL